MNRVELCAQLSISSRPTASTLAAAVNDPEPKLISVATGNDH